GGVGRLHLEGMRAVRDTRVALRARAGSERSAVERALEARARLGAEAEARSRAVARIRRRARDRSARRNGIDGPGVAGRGTGVAGGVGRLHLEGVRAVSDTGVAL